MIKFWIFLFSGINFRMSPKLIFFALAATIAVQRGVSISNKERTDGKRYKTILNLTLF